MKEIRGEEVLGVKLMNKKGSNINSNEEVTHREKRDRVISECASDSIWEWDSFSNKIVIPSYLKELFGYSDEEIEGSIDFMTDFVHPEDVEKEKSKLKLYLDKQTDKYETEYRIKTKNRGYRWVCAKGSAMWDAEGRATYMAGLCMDITEIVERRKEEAVLIQSMREKEQLLNEIMEHGKFQADFFSNVSHELRTPLNIILSSIQLLGEVWNKAEEQHRNCPYKIPKYVSIMKQNSYRLLRLINNLIDVNRIDSGFLTLNIKNHNLVSAIEDVILSVVPYVESKEIDIVFDTDVEEKVMAFDHDNLERIILNLISNAVKFTEAKGKIEVSVEDKGNHVEVRIKDNGIGMPKDKLDIIFERFKQVDYSPSNLSQGSGIGLFLVKGLVEAHGGTITVHSTIGEGSEFIINLPVIVLAEEEIASENELKLDNNGKITLEFSSVQ